MPDAADDGAAAQKIGAYLACMRAKLRASGKGEQNAEVKEAAAPKEAAETAKGGSSTSDEEDVWVSDLREE